MNLNQLKLNKKFQALLYQNTLVCTKDNFDVKQDELNFLGNNEKGIVFIVSDPNSKFLDDSQWEFFNNLLNACGLTVADIALINFYHTAVSYDKIKQQLSASILLAFGVNSKQLDLSFAIPAFQIQNYNGQTIMLCPSLAEIQTNKELKKQLWLCLQKIFNIQKQK